MILRGARRKKIRKVQCKGGPREERFGGEKKKRQLKARKIEGKGNGQVVLSGEEVEEQKEKKKPCVDQKIGDFEQPEITLKEQTQSRNPTSKRKQR